MRIKGRPLGAERVAVAQRTQQPFAEVDPHADVLGGPRRRPLRRRGIFGGRLQGVGLPLRRQDEGLPSGPGDRSERDARRQFWEGRRSLTKTALVAGLVSISLSERVPLDCVRWAPTRPPRPSPAVLLRSLSAPSVSPELLLI